MRILNYGNHKDHKGDLFSKVCNVCRNIHGKICLCCVHLATGVISRDYYGLWDNRSRAWWSVFMRLCYIGPLPALLVVELHHSWKLWSGDRLRSFYQTHMYREFLPHGAVMQPVRILSPVHFAEYPVGHRVSFFCGRRAVVLFVVLL